MTDDHPDIQGEDHGSFKRMTRPRFEAMALWGLPQAMREDTRTASCWQADGERVLAAVLHLVRTKEFMCVAFARDRVGRYRTFRRSQFLPTARAGELALRRDFGRSLLASPPELPADAARPAGVDLFAPLDPIGRRNDAFALLRDSFNQAAAREILRELCRWIPDLDGNLVRDLQTSGYSARIWELYLWAAFRSLNFDVGTSHRVPDFCLSKPGAQVFIEATTVNAQDTFGAAIGAGPPEAPARLWPYLEHEMPQRFGSPLFSKMKKRYWEKPHVAGRPLLLAIADFHAPASMLWSHAALPFYLYGVRLMTTVGADNQLVDAFVPGGDHVVGSKVVPTNFFAQPDTQHISGVLFSNAGTITKFNRMGVIAGFGDPWVSLVRTGTLIDPAAGYASLVPFSLDVENPDYDEHWADELILYHNPRALHPVDDTLFPGITHVRIEGEQYVAHGPPATILTSSTTSYDFLRRREGFPGSIIVGLDREDGGSSV